MEQSELLFGSDPTEHVVAIEQAGDRMLLYIRDGEAVSVEERPFRPWIYTADKYPLDGASWQEAEPAPIGHWLNHIARFGDWSSFMRARSQLREAAAPHLAPGSPHRQFLTAAGVTLFKGMGIADLRCLTIDIETTTLEPGRADAKVLMVAMCDNHGFEACLTGSEEDILRDLVDRVRELDPDVIQGHNLLGFDLPYLEERAKRLRIPLTLGRDGSGIVQGTRRNAGGGPGMSSSPSFYIHGRHVVDTMIGVQRYDVPRGELTSFGLKAVAQSLGIASPDRIILDRSKMAELAESDPETVRTYALQDARDTRALGELVLATDFYQTQMVPEGFQQVTVMGMGDKINALMQRAYLHANHPIPLPQPGAEVPGGYTEVRRTGILRPVVKADAQSLYPSIMLRFAISPSTDKLNVFLPMLRELTDRRIDAKGRMTRAQAQERQYWDALQGSFKILINSFYGYLGTQLHFNDPQAAGQVTTRGQEIVKAAATEIEQLGGLVIEVDTDGIYFVPPDGVRGRETEEAFVEKVGSKLPDGIHLVHDGSYEAMISLKVKNYVLQKHDGGVIFRGASLRSRADERFGKEFIERAVALLFEDKTDELSELYISTAKQIADGQIPAWKLARRERVTDKTFASAQKKRSRAAAEESGARIGDFVQVYEAKDGSLRPLDRYDGDEDRDYYLDKLYKFACRLREAVPNSFDTLIPRPGSTRLNVGTQLSLFDD